MKDKFVMIVGVGISKFLQILFSLYLSYKFSHEALVVFISIVTLASAISSITSLGSSPQIIRAGVHPNPVKYIENILGVACLILFISLLCLMCYLFLGGGRFQLFNLNLIDYLVCTVCMVVSLVFYSIMHSYLSYQQKYFSLGLLLLVIYFFSFISSIILSLFITDSRSIIIYYFLSLLIGNSVGLFCVLRYKISVLAGLKILLTNNSILKEIIYYIKVAMFGFITMFSLYLSIKNIITNLDMQSAAIYSVSFQLFQIGIFLPSVLGSIFVPKLVNDHSLEYLKKMKKIYIYISFAWLFFSLLSFYPIFKVYSFNFNTDFVLTFLIMQLCVVFASIQAFYIQNYVAKGEFLLLMFVSFVWGVGLLMLQYLFPNNILYSSVSLLIAYVISNILFLFLNKLSIK